MVKDFSRGTALNKAQKWLFTFFRLNPYIITTCIAIITHTFYPYFVTCISFMGVKKGAQGHCNLVVLEEGLAASFNSF